MSEDEDRKPAATTVSSSKPTHPQTQEPPPSGDELPVKPALKKKSAAPKSKQLKWDEPTIEEHDLLRGTRMSIDEPNTPYAHYDSGAESDDSRRARSPANQKQVLSWDTLQTKLDSVAAVRAAFPSSPSSSYAETDHSDIEEERKKEMRKLEFREHRKRHYNEMEQVRRFRKDHPDGTDDEDGGDADVED